MSVLVWDAVGGGLLGLHNCVTRPDKGQGVDQQQEQQQQQRRHRISRGIGAEWGGEERQERERQPITIFPWSNFNIKLSHSLQAVAGEEGICEVDDGETMVC